MIKKNKSSILTTIKIAILHTANTHNLGTMMMVTNFIYYFQSLSKHNITFYVDNEEIDGLERIRESVLYKCNVERLTEIGLAQRPLLPKNCDVITKLFRYVSFSLGFYRPLKRNAVDVVVFLGGDDLSEYYNLKGVFLEFLKIRSMVTHNLMVCLFGQTIGPFRSWRTLLARNILSKTLIWARDHTTVTYLKEHLDIADARFTTDLALLDLPRQNKFGNNVLKDLDIGHDSYITIVPSGIWKSYCSDKHLYLSAWADIIKTILKKFSHRIILLPHVSSDLDIQRFLVEKYDFAKEERISTIKKILTPHEAREILGNGEYTITGRMHAAISTFHMGRPAISLSYSVKYKGVLSTIGRDDLVIEAVSDDIWERSIVKAVIAKIAYVERNYHSLCDQITGEIAHGQQIAMNELENFRDMIA